jgi:hypothetical protein
VTIFSFIIAGGQPFVVVELALNRSGSGLTRLFSKVNFATTIRAKQALPLQLQIHREIHFGQAPDELGEI